MIEDNRAGERETRDICNVQRIGRFVWDGARRTGACTAVQETTTRGRNGGCEECPVERGDLAGGSSPRVWECTAIESTCVLFIFGERGGVCVRVCYACRCRVEGRTKSHVGLGMEQGISAG